MERERVKKISSGWVKKYPGQRRGTASYLLPVKSKLGSNQGPSLLLGLVLIAATEGSVLSPNSYNSGNLMTIIDIQS